jgi:hypothetical protein
LALFPGVIFLFTLIPFIPVAGFQSELFKLLRDVLPPNSFDAAYTTITDILTIKRGDLLSVTVLAAFFFATNGTLSLIGNFGQSIHRLNVRGFWSQYLAAFLLTLALSVLLIVGISRVALLRVFQVPALIVQADSMYAIDTYTKWMDGHARRGWVTSAKKPTANRDILEQLIEVRDARRAAGLPDVVLEHVRGHRGHRLNSWADERAVRASQHAAKGEELVWTSLRGLDPLDVSVDPPRSAGDRAR